MLHRTRTLQVIPVRLHVKRAFERDRFIYADVPLPDVLRRIQLTSPNVLIERKQKPAA